MNVLVTLNYEDAAGCKKVISQAEQVKAIGHTIVVDNASPDGSYTALLPCQSDTVDVIEAGDNRGYSAGYNFGLRYAATYNPEYVFICNSDIRFGDEIIDACIRFLDANPGYGGGYPGEYLLRKGRKPVVPGIFRISGMISSGVFFCGGISEPPNSMKNGNFFQRENIQKQKHYAVVFAVIGTWL